MGNRGNFVNFVRSDSYEFLKTYVIDPFKTFVMDILLKYFPRISDEQREQFATMLGLYPEWNEKINVISRKDIDNLEINHILHSLAIAKFINFSPGSEVLDFGCGGGFPGIPLAVMFPEVHFHLIDRIGKKLRVAEDVATNAGLKNVTFQHGDIGECHALFDFVVSRAVMPQADMVKLLRKNISPKQRNGYPNGIISLKGGDLQAELNKVRMATETLPISTMFDEPYFKTKEIVYTPIIK